MNRYRFILTSVSTATEANKKDATRDRAWNIQGVPADLAAQVRAVAALQDRTITEVVIEAARIYVAGVSLEYAPVKGTGK